MCGIAGLLNLDGRPADGGVVGAMTRALAHRGPDGEGVHVEGAQRVAVVGGDEKDRRQVGRREGRHDVDALSR